MQNAEIRNIHSIMCLSLKGVVINMELSKTSKNLIQMIGVAALALIIIGTVIYRSIDALYFAIGVILTSSLNVGKVWLIERTVQKTLELDDQNAGKNYVRFQFIVRYVLSGIVLAAAGLISVYVEPPFINIWGAIVGMFTLQISGMIVRHTKLKDEM